MDWYVWVKTLHVLAIISWMAGILYLPRLFVYHVGALKGSVQSETFKVMERRLLRAIMTPAMIVAWASGLALTYRWVESGAFKEAGWLHAKLLLVVLMSAIHGYLAMTVRRFAADSNRHGGVFFRVVNELPTILLIFIVIMVIVKPSWA